MSKIIVTLTFFFLTLTLVGQDCSDLRNEGASRQDQLVSTSSEKLKTRSSKDVDDAEEDMKKDLLVKLSEKIIIEVESGSTNYVKDDGGAIIQLFSSETKINSNTKLGNLKFEFCFDDKYKTLFGRCTLNKAGLAESIIKDCITRLIALNAEIEGFKRSGNSINVRPLVVKYERITSDFQTALFINHQINTTEWNILVADYNKAISQISNSDDILDLNASIETATDHLNKDEFEEAIAILKALRNKYKHNDDIEYHLQQAYDLYLSHTRLLASKFVQQHDYRMANELVDNYCAVAVCNSEAKALREELRRGYFTEAADMLESSMRAKDDEKSNDYYSQLTRMSDINANRFKELSEKYQNYKIERLMEKARIERDKRNFWEAYSLVRTTEQSYGISNGELKSLKDELFKKILHQEIAEEKKYRSHLNSFEFGVEGYSNETDLRSASSFKANTIFLGFSAGLYYKYNFGPVNDRKGYAVRSDIVGIKCRYVDFPSNFPITDNSSAGRVIPSGHLFEIGGDGVLMRIFHYNISAVYNQDSHVDGPMGMSTSFGFRLPIRNVAFGLDGRYFNNFVNYTSLNVVGYVHGKLDFRRQYSRADKRRVRARLKDF